MQCKAKDKKCNVFFLKAQPAHSLLHAPLFCAFFPALSLSGKPRLAYNAQNFCRTGCGIPQKPIKPVETFMSRSLPRSLPFALTALALCSPALAQPLSFTAARDLTLSRADEIKVAEAETAYRYHQAEADKSLHGPKVTINVKQLWGKKDIDFGTVSLPTGISSLPSLSLPLQYDYDLKGPRALASIELPIYTGGAVSAKIAASEAAVSGARAGESAKRDAVENELVQKYFYAQLMRSVQKLRAETLEQQEKELAKAIAFEKKGLISRVERMSIEVARDAAKRALAVSTTDRSVADRELANLLREKSVDALTTPLFVVTGDLGTLSDWKKTAQENNPSLRAADAQRSAAGEGINAAKAAWKPQLYAFAQKNLIKHYLTITEPDWTAGIGLKYTLWDNQDRMSSLSAAKALASKADAARAELQNRLDTAVETAFLKTQQSRDEYQLTRSTLELAEENLRLREKSFAEGLSDAVALSEARNQRTAAQIARREAAYKFVAAWAALHAAAGRMDAFLLSVSDASNLFEYPL